MWSAEPNRLPKEDLLPDWARRDNQVKKGDGVEYSYFECVQQYRNRAPVRMLVFWISPS